MLLHHQLHHRIIESDESDTHHTEGYTLEGPPLTGIYCQVVGVFNYSSFSASVSRVDRTHRDCAVSNRLAALQ
jgi:hypothetical protein